MQIEQDSFQSISPKGKYRQFRVNNDEMDCGHGFNLSEGDIVLARRIDEKYWTKRLNIESWFFILVFKNGEYVVRKIIEHNVEQMSVLCHPQNPMYADSTIFLYEICELYNVIKVIDKNTKL